MKKEINPIISSRKFKPEECDESGVPYPSCNIKPLKKEFNLSEKINLHEDGFYYAEDKDVKEFIRFLKEELDDFNWGDLTLAINERNNRIIDKLAGKEIVE